MGIRVDWSRNAGILIAKPIGRVYSANYLEWQTALESGIKAADRAVVVDFGQVPYLSSAGLRVLLTTAKRFAGPGGSFVLCNLTRTVGKVIRASGFDGVIPVYDTEAAAVAAITGERGADDDGSED